MFFIIKKRSSYNRKRHINVREKYKKCQNFKFNVEMFTEFLQGGNTFVCNV
ncbi:hypothetical protein Bhyg_11691 [Pseudolycoriella hygida]|uniref:Uncharacterized protein n=1 Tax=Pseudolycoriella hygida TaxID=35572 RepID=A0A9Q0S0H4_9DIPT|nr:hypothetical protein Bhyg_11691 [Pseudolycoriella hygida]